MQAGCNSAPPSRALHAVGVCSCYHCCTLPESLLAQVFASSALFGRCPQQVLRIPVDFTPQLIVKFGLPISLPVARVAGQGSRGGRPLHHPAEGEEGGCCEDDRKAEGGNGRRVRAGVRPAPAVARLAPTFSLQRPCWTTRPGVCRRAYPSTRVADRMQVRLLPGLGAPCSPQSQGQAA